MGPFCPISGVVLLLLFEFLQPSPARQPTSTTSLRSLKRLSSRCKAHSNTRQDASRSLELSQRRSEYTEFVVGEVCDLSFLHPLRFSKFRHGDAKFQRKDCGSARADATRDPRFVPRASPSFQPPCCSSYRCTLISSLSFSPSFNPRTCGCASTDETQATDDAGDPPKSQLSRSQAGCLVSRIGPPYASITAIED